VSRRRRTMGPPEFKIGQPLPCDAYDGRGMLLLCKGHVITSAAQLERLVQNALLTDVLIKSAPDSRARASPLSLILAARQRLHVLFAAPASPKFPTELLRVVGMLRRACKANADVALASILMCRDGPYAIRHAVNVAIASCIAGTAMELAATELNTTVAAALTMNIGMFELQEQLHALDGSLTDEQRIEVHDHCERGVALLRQRNVTGAPWLNIVRDHHERPDGRGYPAGKAGDAIGLTTQLVSLADVYCARVSSRAYRPAMRPNVALRWLFLNEGVAVDEYLAALFIKTLGIYPPGTGVRLHNGSIAVVTHRGTTGRTPKVASITTHDGLRIGVPIRRRGDVQGHAVSEVVDLDALELVVGMETLWGPDAIP
jgi:HD-GYP domain-containing protein (c-di-GMP phosphodiesterase class II)